MLLICFNLFLLQLKHFKFKIIVHKITIVSSRMTSCPRAISPQTCNWEKSCLRHRKVNMEPTPTTTRQRTRKHENSHLIYMTKNSLALRQNFALARVCRTYLCCSSPFDHIKHQRGRQKSFVWAAKFRKWYRAKRKWEEENKFVNNRKYRYHP